MRREARARIVVTTFGTLGDLSPLLAIGRGLRDRGHDVRVATIEPLQEHVARWGFPFHPVRPHVLPDAPRSPATNLDAGTEILVRDVLCPAIADSYADLRHACEGADLIVSHMLALSAPIVAAAMDVPWVSVVLQPLGFLSSHERLVTFSAHTPSGLDQVDADASRTAWQDGRAAAHGWGEPVRRFRRSLGLSDGDNPIYADHHSPHLVLACFSMLFARPRPDWSAHTHVTGFPFDDRERSVPPAALESFLSRGEPPVVITLGSHAPFDGDGFYVTALRAALALDRRVVLLGQGSQAYAEAVCAQQPWARDRVCAFDYVPYARLFPRADVIVHHGGIGSIAAGLRAGRPMLLVPAGFDQLHNAWHAAHLGFARAVASHHFTFGRAAVELSRLLGDSSERRAAACAAAVIRKEDGARTACDAIEELLDRARRPRSRGRGQTDAHFRRTPRRLAHARLHRRRALPARGLAE